MQKTVKVFLGLENSQKKLGDYNRISKILRNRFLHVDTEYVLIPYPEIFLQEFAKESATISEDTIWIFISDKKSLEDDMVSAILLARAKSENSKIICVGYRYGNVVTDTFADCSITNQPALLNILQEGQLDKLFAPDPNTAGK